MNFFVRVCGSFKVRHSCVQLCLLNKEPMIVMIYRPVVLMSCFLIGLKSWLQVATDANEHSEAFSGGSEKFVGQTASLKLLENRKVGFCAKTSLAQHVRKQMETEHSSRLAVWSGTVVSRWEPLPVHRTAESTWSLPTVSDITPNGGLATCCCDSNP